MTTTFDPRPSLKAVSDADPAAVGEALIRLAQKAGGVLTPAAVVQAAAIQSSPLHGYFLWDDTEAARAWRLHQARNLIASVRVQMVGPAEPQEPVRAWVSVLTDAGRAYRQIDAVMSEPLAREAYLAAALRELERVRRQYADLEELSAVWSALDSAAA